MGKYDPPRKELWFRLAVGVFILAFMGAAVLYRGVPTGPAAFEVIGMAILVGGGTVAWCVWKLMNSDRDDDSQT